MPLVHLHAIGPAADLQVPADHVLSIAGHGMRIGVAGHPAAGEGHAVRVVVVHLHGLAVRPGDDPDAAEMVAQEEQVLRFGSVHGDQAAVEQDVLQRVVRAHQIAAVLGPGQGPVLPEDRGLHLHRLHRELTRSRTGTCPSRGPPFPALCRPGDR